MLGIEMHCLSYPELFPLFDAWLANKSAPSRSIACVNVNCCVSALFDRRLRAIYNQADIAGMDGMPFVRWARAFHYPAADRLYAPDLMLEVAAKAAEKGYTFFLYGGVPGAPERLQTYLTAQFPDLRVVGAFSPPFRPLSPAEDAEVCAMIQAAQPDFLWVGLGSPKQDLWIHDHRPKIRGSIMVAAGATFDFFSGRIKQAPPAIRSAGLEWLFRLALDFRRLWMRYTVYNAIFLAAFALQLAGVARFRTAQEPADDGGQKDRQEEYGDLE
ncbi:MAG: WecB/TagA/CpsF family glycosyltransferase [Candidatus Promineifilaceae bacterium]